jgi:catechol 2,3-dioxygenase-like lactoylglutathione lyase family enzyme
MNIRPQIDQQITFLYTTDLLGTTVFYEDVMGLELVLDQKTCRIYQISSNAFLGICKRSNIEIGPGNVIITIVTADVDAWYEFLSDKGVAFEKPPSFNPQYKIYHCFIRDPNGYLIEIQRFEDPRWEG